MKFTCFIRRLMRRKSAGFFSKGCENGDDGMSCLITPKYVFSLIVKAILVDALRCRRQVRQKYLLKA